MSSAISRFRRAIDAASTIDPGSDPPPERLMIATALALAGPMIIDMAEAMEARGELDEQLRAAGAAMGALSVPEDARCVLVVVEPHTTDAEILAQARAAAEQPLPLPLREILAGEITPDGD